MDHRTWSMRGKRLSCLTGRKVVPLCLIAKLCVCQSLNASHLDDTNMMEEEGNSSVTDRRGQRNNGTEISQSKWVTSHLLLSDFPWKRSEKSIFWQIVSHLSNDVMVFNPETLTLYKYRCAGCGTPRGDVIQHLLIVALPYGVTKCARVNLNLAAEVAWLLSVFSPLYLWLCWGPAPYPETKRKLSWLCFVCAACLTGRTIPSAAAAAAEGQSDRRQHTSRPDSRHWMSLF